MTAHGMTTHRAIQLAILIWAALALMYAQTADAGSVRHQKTPEQVCWETAQGIAEARAQGAPLAQTLAAFERWRELYPDSSFGQQAWYVPTMREMIAAGYAAPDAREWMDGAIEQCIARARAHQS